MPPTFISRIPIYTHELRTYGYELRLFGTTDRPTGSLERLAQRVDLQCLAGADGPVLLRPDVEDLPQVQQLSWPHDRIVVVLPASCFGGAWPGELADSGFRLAVEPSADCPELPATGGAVALCSVPAQQLVDWQSLESRGLSSCGPKLLTRGLESADQYERGIRLGFHLFSGEFFEKPRQLHGGDLAGNRLQIMQLLARLQDPNISVEDVSVLVRKDLTLSYKLLRMLNSAFFGIPKKVDSISRAVVFFGLQRIKNWATVLLVNAVDFQPRELLITAMIRGRMCELLAGDLNRPNPERYYLTGLFSLLDSIMDIPRETLLAKLGLADEIDDALLNGQGPLGQVLTAVVGFERGQREFLDGLGGECETLIQQTYLDALRWTQDAYRQLG